MLDFNQQLEKLIAESLPQKTADELRKFIDNSNKLSVELENVKSTNEKLLKDNGELSSNVKKQEYLTKKEDELNTRSQLLNDLERSLKITELEFKLKETERRSTELFGLVSLLVKNPRAIELISGTENFSGYYDENGRWIENRIKSVNLEKEKIEEK